MGTTAGSAQLPRAGRRNVLLIHSVAGPISIPVKLSPRGQLRSQASAASCEGSRCGPRFPERHGESREDGGHCLRGARAFGWPGRAIKRGRNCRLSLFYSSPLGGRGRGAVVARSHHFSAAPTCGEGERRNAAPDPAVFDPLGFGVEYSPCNWVLGRNASP